MNIAVSVNKKFIMPLKVMLFSLYENIKSKDIELNIFFLNSGLGRKDIADIKYFVRNKLNAKLYIINIDEPLFRASLHSKEISKETYNRILLPYILPNKVKKVFWLDADLIVNGDICDFYNTDINDFFLLATEEPRPDRIKELGLPLEQKHFNAGVIVLNVEKIRSEISKETMIEYIRSNGPRLEFMDQDVLNVFMGGNTLFWKDDTYNNVRHRNEVNNLDNARIIHFITYMKPWKYYYDGYGKEYFWSYAGKCGYRIRKVFHYLLNPLVRIVHKKCHDLKCRWYC